MRNLSVIKGLYQGNGVTRRWAIPFEYNDTAQIFVTLTTYDEGDYTYRVLDSTEYTIDEDSVEIVYPKTDDDAPIPSTQYLTVWRDTDLLQLMDLTNQGAAWPDSIEASLDKLHQIVQELAEGLSRSLKVDIGDPQTPDEKLVAIQDYVLAAAESSRSASASEASAQRSAEAAATSEANAAESERLANGYADTASDAASRAEDSAISARAYNAPDYDNAKTYQVGEVVTYTDGNSYKALQETTGNEPPNIIYWQKVTDYVGDNFFEIDEYGYIVPTDSPSHSRYWRIDQAGYIVPIEGGDGGYRPDTRSLSAEFLNVTNEGFVKHLRADDINAQEVDADEVTAEVAAFNTLTANAINVQSASAGTLTAEDVIAKGPVVDVRAFGAKGDGVHDDTQAIQSAIDYAINNGIGMIVLSKSYVISAPLVIRNANGLTLFTPDSGCRLIASQNFIGDVNNGDYMIRIHASHHVTIKGIVFICNSIANGVSIANDGDAYTTAYSINIYLQYLNIADPKDNGVDISAGCGYIYLNNVRVHHVSNTPCTFIDVGSRYYRTIGFMPQYIYIYNCQLEGGESEADLTGIKFAACQYAWVRDNDICNMVAGTAILCKPNLDVDGNEQILIEGNSFFNNATAVFLDCSDKFNNGMQIKNNILYFRRTSDILVKQINPNELTQRCFPLEIVGNNITSPTALSPTKYISLEYANQVTISGNSLTATLQTTWQNGISLGNSIMAKYDQFIMSHTDDGYTAQRIGNKVILNINFATANVVDKNTSMLTVNSDYVPKQLVGAGRGMAGDANGVLSNVGVVIDTNGNVYHSSSTPRKTLIATLIYLTD